MLTVVMLTLALVTPIQRQIRAHRPVCHQVRVPMYWADGTVTSMLLTVCEGRRG